MKTKKVAIYISKARSGKNRYSYSISDNKGRGNGITFINRGQSTTNTSEKIYPDPKSDEYEDFLLSITKLIQFVIGELNGEEYLDYKVFFNQNKYLSSHIYLGDEKIVVTPYLEVPISDEEIEMFFDAFALLKFKQQVNFEA